MLPGKGRRCGCVSLFIKANSFCVSSLTVQIHGYKDKREAGNVISGLADLIPFQVKHVFYSARFDAGAITCLPEQTWKSAVMRIPNKPINLFCVTK